MTEGFFRTQDSEIPIQKIKDADPDPLGDKALALLNEYLTTPITPEVLPVHMARLLLRQRNVDNVNDPRLGNASPSNFSFIRSSEGTGLVIVPEGYAALLKPDDTTAIATIGLLTCYGYAARLNDTEEDRFAIMHFKLEDNPGTLSTFLKNVPPGQMQEAVFSLCDDPYNLDQTERIRGILGKQQEGLREPIAPDLREGKGSKNGGMLITPNGGSFLRKLEHSSAYRRISQWTWQKGRQ